MPGSRTSNWLVIEQARRRALQMMMDLMPWLKGYSFLVAVGRKENLPVWECRGNRRAQVQERTFDDVTPNSETGVRKHSVDGHSRRNLARGCEVIIHPATSRMLSKAPNLKRTCPTVPVLHRGPIYTRRRLSILEQSSFFSLSPFLQQHKTWARTTTRYSVLIARQTMRPLRRPTRRWHSRLVVST